MKRSIKLMLLGILLTVTGCQPKQCWKCIATQTSTTWPGSARTETETETTVCDKTAEEILNVEKTGTVKSTSTVGKTTVTTDIITECE